MFTLDLKQTTFSIHLFVWTPNDNANIDIISMEYFYSSARVKRARKLRSRTKSTWSLGENEQKDFTSVTEVMDTVVSGARPVESLLYFCNKPGQEVPSFTRGGSLTEGGSNYYFIVLKKKPINAGIRLHNMLVFHDGHHVRLGARSAIHSCRVSIHRLTARRV